jgi:TRAP transporter TAXI family solute receptor
LTLSHAIADTLNEADLGLKMSVFETGGSAENLRLLESRRVDMATLMTDTLGSDKISAIITLYSDAYHLIARDEAGILSFADLDGKRVAIPPQSSGQYQSFWFLADHYRLDRDNINALPMAERAAMFAMEQGQIDAVFRVRAPGNIAISELIGDKNLHLVPIGQSEALALKQPAIKPGVIPQGSYRGSPALPAEDLPTALVERLLVARSNLDSSLVYKITRALFERRSEMLESTRLAGLIGPLPEDALGVISAHPGARTFYDREKPGFMQQNARMMSAVLSAVAILTSALLALRTHWVRSRRIRMHHFNRRLMDIASSARKEHGVNDLLGAKQQLLDILQEVIGDLERERVSQEEFEHFSFTWQAVDALVRDRLQLGDTLLIAEKPA